MAALIADIDDWNHPCVRIHDRKDNSFKNVSYHPETETFEVKHGLHGSPEDTDDLSAMLRSDNIIRKLERMATKTLGQWRDHEWNAHPDPRQSTARQKIWETYNKDTHRSALRTASAILQKRDAVAERKLRVIARAIRNRWRKQVIIRGPRNDPSPREAMIHALTVAHDPDQLAAALLPRHIPTHISPAD